MPCDRLLSRSQSIPSREFPFARIPSKKTPSLKKNNKRDPTNRQETSRFPFSFWPHSVWCCTLASSRKHWGWVSSWPCHDRSLVHVDVGDLVSCLADCHSSLRHRHLHCHYHHRRCRWIHHSSYRLHWSFLQILGPCDIYNTLCLISGRALRCQSHPLPR